MIFVRVYSSGWYGSRHRFLRVQYMDVRKQKWCLPVF